MLVPVIFTTPARTLSSPLAAVPVAAGNSMQFLTSVPVSTMSVSLLDSYSFSHQLTITLQDGNTPPQTSTAIRWRSIGHVPHDDAVAVVETFQSQVACSAGSTPAACRISS